MWATFSIITSSGTVLAQTTPKQCNTFVQLRADAQHKAAAVSTAAQNKVERKEICTLVQQFSAAEVAVLKFLEKNRISCAIPEDAIDTAKANHEQTLKFRTAACTESSPTRPNTLGNANTTPSVNTAGKPNLMHAGSGATSNVSQQPVATTDDLVDLIAQHRVEAEVVGSGIQTVTVRVRATLPQSQPIAFTVPVGTFFAASNSASQSMVSTTERASSILGDGWVTITVPAACANKPRNIPGLQDRFSVRRLPQQAELATAVKALDGARASYPIVQAAVWIITDNATFGGMGTLIRRPFNSPLATGTRVISPDDATRALKILDGAGINIERKAIWLQDRQILATKVTDKSLADWLKSKSN